jgi:NAD(P)H dehydrogenase (quinone)
VLAIASISRPIAVTGATGALGGRVAQRLAALGVPQRAVVHDERAAMTEVLRGSDTLFLVADAESPTRAEDHRTAVDAAVDAGVQHIVYTSFIGAAPDAVFTFARHHHDTEEHIRATGLTYTFLRDSMSLDDLPMSASAEGVIAAPAGDGQAAWISRDDFADVAAVVLTQDGHEGETYEVTGREPSTLAYAAEVLSDFSGCDVSYQEETVHEAYESRADYGAPDWEVEGWVTSYEAVAEGAFDFVTDVVPALTGHEAQTLREFLADNPDSYAHLL